jgi:hypothetical protein
MHPNNRSLHTKVLAQMRVPVDLENADMRTPLHEAAAAGRTAAVAKLAELGADVNATCLGDWTPLHLSAMRGHLGAQFTRFTSTTVQILTQTHAVDRDVLEACGARQLRLGA